MRAAFLQNTVAASAALCTRRCCLQACKPWLPSLNMPAPCPVLWVDFFKIRNSAMPPVSLARTLHSFHLRGFIKHLAGGSWHTFSFQAPRSLNFDQVSASFRELQPGLPELTIVAIYNTDIKAFCA